MSIRKIARLGHPILRQKAREVTQNELQSSEFNRLIQDLKDTMEEFGGLGLAAPQIYESIQVAVICFSEGNPRYPNMGQEPLRVYINPKITILDPTEQSYWEGCLSIPELRGLVVRPRKIKITYWNEGGEIQDKTAEDFLATVFQHELDHLNGVLFVDLIKPIPGKTELAFVEEFRRYIQPQS